jgi:DNA-binding CsgD family transcriptional regulator
MLLTRLQDPTLIAGFYEAAADPAQWQPTWSAVCRAFEAPAGLLYHQADRQTPPRILASAACEGPGLRMYAPLVPVPETGADAPGFDIDMHFRTILGQEMATPQLFDRADPCGNFCRPFGGGAYHVLGASVPLDGAARAGIGLHRPIDAPAFDEEDRAALDSVTRHLAAALRLAGALQAERQAAIVRGAALDGLRHGAVITDPAGVVQFANGAAMRLAEEGGLVLGLPGSVLSCEKPAEAVRLADLIREASRGESGGCARITRGGRRSMLAAVVSPLTVDVAASASVAPCAARLLALVSLRDLGDTCDAAQTYLMELFGLTAAEAAILPQLLAGDSASLIAQSRGVQVATIRTQVSRVLAKTGAANLRALASMVAALG